MQQIAIVLLALGLVNGLAAYGATSRSVGLTVNIRPAVAVTLLGGSAVEIKIRLSPRVQAMVWKADACSAVPPNGYVIGQSGIYREPVSAIAGQGSKLCIASSDGVLTRELSLPPLP